MAWHGWTWDRKARRWLRRCAAPTASACARELERLHPGLPNLHYAVTRGQAPSWEPGRLAWER